MDEQQKATDEAKSAVDGVVSCHGELTPYRYCIIGYNIAGIDGSIRFVGAGGGDPEYRFTYCPYCSSEIKWGN